MQLVAQIGRSTRQEVLDLLRTASTMVTNAALVKRQSPYRRQILGGKRLDGILQGA